MRKTNLVTISLPPQMISEAEKVAKKQGMTRSEFFRHLFRRYLEEMQFDEAVQVYEKEKKEGKLKVLKGSLADLIGS